MIDLHCHILPGVDDGAENMEDAIAMARHAAQSGVTDIVATPHFRGERSSMQLLPLIDALFCEVNPIPAKQAMKLIGFDCGTCRLPLTPAKPDTANRLKDALNIG